MYDPGTLAVILAGTAAVGTGYSIYAGERGRRTRKKQEEEMKSKMREQESERERAEKEAEEATLLAGRRERERGLRRRGRRATIVSPLAEGFSL